METVFVSVFKVRLCPACAERDNLADRILRLEGPTWLQRAPW